MRQLVSTPQGSKKTVLLCDYCEGEIDSKDIKKSTIKVHRVDGYEERHVCPYCAEILYDNLTESYFDNII